MTLRRALRRAGIVVAAAATLAGLAAIATGAWRARLVRHAPTLLVRDRQGRFLGELPAAGAGDGDLGYWPLPVLPPRVVAATLAAEDHRFWRHPGVDPLALGRAALQDLSAGRRVSGASTIPMQVARLQDPGPRTAWRKAVEAVAATCLTARCGREEVLRQYLTIVPEGCRMRGVAYAARRTFDEPPQDLDWAQAAFLAAIPQAPAHRNPWTLNGRAEARARARRILFTLRRQGTLSREEFETAGRELARLVPGVLLPRPEDAIHAVLRLGATLEDAGAREAVARSPIVTSTLDLDVQHEASWRALETVDALRDAGARQAAVLVVDLADASVLAHVGSVDWFDSSASGAMDFAATPRSPGSLLKPLLYALALDRGALGPASILDDIGHAPGGIENADHTYLGPILPRVALANSRNVPAARVVQLVGLDRAAGLLEDAGLAPEAGRTAEDYGLALAIGAWPASLDRLATAMTALASDGILRELRWYRGETLPRPRRLLGEDACRETCLWLSDPLARLPSFPRMGPLEYPFPVAVKTGTSSGYRDAWAIAWSRRYLVACWIGDPSGHPMKALTGARSSARLARQLLTWLHRDEPRAFAQDPLPEPRGARQVRVCSLTGGLATSACDRVYLESFAPSQTLPDACAAHVRLVVDRATGALATASTPASRRASRTFVDLPARDAEWQAVSGLPRPPPGLAGASRPGSAAREATRAVTSLARVASVRVTSPLDGSELAPDPEMPPGQSTLALSVTVDPPAPQVVWYVDGSPFQLADYPYAARWPLSPGEHVFQARVPSAEASSRRIRVRVD